MRPGPVRADGAYDRSVPPARRLIALLCPLVLLASAGSAWGAQDVGTADPSKPITVEVTYPCSPAAKGLQTRLIANAPEEASAASILQSCRAGRGTRVVAVEPTEIVVNRDRRSTLVIGFHDMNGDPRTVTVYGPDPGAREAKVTYGGTRAVAPADQNIAEADQTIAGSQKNTTTKACRWVRPADVSLPSFADDVAHCEVTESQWTRTWIVQRVAKKVPDFGGVPGENGLTLYVSTWTDDAAATGRPSWAHANAPATVPGFTLPPLGEQSFDGFPRLLGYTRWSKFSPGGYQGYLQGKHYPLIFGSLTFSGYGVYGPGDRYGAPTNAYGRNVYIDTFESDYGPGWRRIMGVLTQPPNGAFCYEISKKGGSKSRNGISSLRMYRLTAIGPGLTPVVQVTITGPTFRFGADDYDPKTMKWGTGFSFKQAQALRDQAAMIGPRYRTKPKGKGSTDCGATLRQLPEAFFAPPPA